MHTEIVNRVSGKLRNLTLEELAKFMDAEPAYVLRLLEEKRALYPGARGFVLFENLELRFPSKRWGDTRPPPKLCIWGPGCTFNQETLTTAHMGDVPSCFLHPTALYEHETAD